MRIVVTGTDTGVGKTVRLRGALRRTDTTYVKAAQTGRRRRRRRRCSELIRRDDAHARALSRAAVARALRRAGRRAVHHAARDRATSSRRSTDRVVIEGAGGLLVQLRRAGTIADVAELLRRAR